MKPSESRLRCNKSLQLLHENKHENRIWTTVVSGLDCHGVSVTYASRSHAGVQPFIKNPGPSFFNDSLIIVTIPCPFCQQNTPIKARLYQLGFVLLQMQHFVVYSSTRLLEHRPLSRRFLQLGMQRCVWERHLIAE